MTNQYEQLDYVAENKPISLISIFWENKPSIPNAPMLASIVVRGKGLNNHVVELLPLLEDYEAFLIWDPSGVNPDYNFSHIPAEHSKAAAAAVIRWLHGKGFVEAKEAKQAAVELKIPETIPVLNIGFTDRELARMRNKQSDWAVVKR